MKKELIILVFVFFNITLQTLGQSSQSNLTQQKQYSENVNYQLFPTKNYWTFIKLDTRNGKMWQVHFSVSDDNNTGEVVLNSEPLVSKENEVKGRFTIYPTENIYNFLLLDQLTGIVIQVQWSMDAKKRGIVSIIKPLNE